MAFGSEAFRAESTEQFIRIYRGGDIAPILVQNAEAHKRPFIHPIAAPDKIGLLTENEPSHHPWQHGLYVGLNKINGIGFWSEGKNDGTFHPKSLQPAVVKGRQITWAVETEWHDPTGGHMITEIQHWTLNDKGYAYELDMEWTLKAEMDLVFGQYPYGGLFLRMPYSSGLEATAINSDGLINNEAEGKRSRWVSVCMPIQGRKDKAGIAIMDHINNPEHPVPWRVDDEFGISPCRCIAGEWKLSHGQAQLFKYRVYVFCGNTVATEIEDNWHAFIQQ